jgi:Ca-activated chloride channel family protein
MLKKEGLKQNNTKTHKHQDKRYLYHMRLWMVILAVALTQRMSAQKAKTAPAPKATYILFVFDASKSMSSKIQNASRMDGAKNLFYKFIDSLSKNKNMQFALRMYGATVKYPPGDCKDSKLVVPFGANNLSAIKQKVSEAKPTGITPIEHSLTESANDFPDAKANNIVIIITDGIEECGGDPCKARQKLMQKGIVFKPFIIGIGLTPQQIKTFECVGNFFDFENSNTFSNISQIIQQQQMSRTTLQVNLLNNQSLPLESNVNMTFYDVQNRSYKYNYIHTINSQNNPDTLQVDDYPTYKIIAHTIPPVESKDSKLNSGKHNIIALDAPQGFLSINRNQGAYNFNEKVKCVVRKGNDMQTINVQQLNSNEKYLTGTYNIEVLTLPRTYVNDLSIEQSKTTAITIADAGVLQTRCLEAGDGNIMVDRGQGLEWVCNLSNQTLQTFYLQPGNYVATWRSKSLRGSIYTIERKFTIRSNNQISVEFFR